MNDNDRARLDFIEQKIRDARMRLGKAEPFGDRNEIDALCAEIASWDAVRGAGLPWPITDDALVRFYNTLECDDLRCDATAGEMERRNVDH